MFNLLRIWLLISVSLCAVFVTETTNVYEIFYAALHEKILNAFHFFITVYYATHWYIIRFWNRR